MANTNRFKGLFRGPIDHQSSSVINSISNGTIDMGSAVALDSTALTVNNETLPRVEQVAGDQGSFLGYGVVVGGDVDGVYGDGSAATDDEERASNAAGQGVVVVTRGRCPARVTGGAGEILIGSALTLSTTIGLLELASAGDIVIARALNGVLGADTDIIAVEVNKEGIL
jgi:hypothetical protein